MRPSHGLGIKGENILNTVAEKFRYYANHPDYNPDEGMCSLLESEGEEELLVEVKSYMKELDNLSVHVTLTKILQVEGIDTTAKEVYEDWDNRPFLENKETFAVGDKVEFRVAHEHYEGKVTSIGPGDFPVKVSTWPGLRWSFTKHGRMFMGSERRLKKVQP